ncbi:uncharacterized protein LOC116295188 [Actinia tenebrosa]|uniref:Uncharacterized protein LOC116295188 n=1 Tax=Actinia tenebrosa TaxID=6105 RepID=A0A6P8HR09_ACTTE|nr:uncharacterized protein LOC116295188 [Actinia tenebrosa]
MATRNKVGNTVNEFLQDMSEYEFTCPICFEEFKEPKSLPNCAHSVCLQCLERMSSERSLTVLECPVCRVASPLSINGVKDWPTNTLIVRLMERSPGRLDKMAIRNAIESCRKVCGTSAKTDEERVIVTGRVKKEIEGKAQKLVEFIRKQERYLLDKIDEVMGSHLSDKDKMREQAWELTDKAEKIIERGDVYEIVDAKDSLVNQLEKFAKELEPGLEVGNFEEILRARIQEEKQGAAEIGKSKSQNSLENIVSYFDPKYNRVITRTKDLQSFFPFDLETSCQGNLVVLDSRFQNITIFDEDGTYKNQFKVDYEDLWGITVTKKDEVVIISNNNDTQGPCGHLVYFDLNGNFIQKKTIKEFKNIFLTSISVDSNDNLVITAGTFHDFDKNYRDGGIVVLKDDLQVKFSTLEQERVNLRKAVLFQGSFYCTEAVNLGSSKPSIKVFNENGKLEREFGSKELQEPHGLAIDSQTQTILVCDRQQNAVVVYKLDGTYITKFGTKEDPLRITMTTNKKDIVITCYLGLCVQMISYEWFLEVIKKTLQSSVKYS